MNFPVSFISRTAALMGEENCKALCEAMQNETPVSIRINTAKTKSIPAESEMIPWTTDGYYLSARPTFTFDPLFRRILSVCTPHIHVRPAVSCRKLLCSRSIVHVS